MKRQLIPSVRGFPNIAFKTMPLFFRLTIVLSLPFKEDHRALPDDWWCDVLGFVPAGSVSSSSTHQIFRDVRHSWWLLCHPVCLLGYYLWLLYIKGSTSTGDLEGGCRTLTFFRFKFLLFQQFHWICVVDGIIMWSDCRFLGQCATTSIVRLEAESG